MQIRKLSIQRYRQFHSLVWCPQPGLNCLIGTGDSGKTTILEAIAKVLSPAPVGAAQDSDYLNRDVESGFEIELVLGALSPELKSATTPPALWGWKGPTEELESAPTPETEEVLRVLVRGTEDLELEHRIVAPNGEEIPLAARIRNQFGLTRVGEMRGSSRDFRMTRGSLVERTLGREQVRSGATKAVRKASSSMTLPPEVERQLGDLSTEFGQKRILEKDLTLELLPPQGQGVLGLIALAASGEGAPIPLSLSGQGTQRLASFLMATKFASESPVFVIDELEVGLEPYRRRALVRNMRGLIGKAHGQGFLTTHSETVVGETRTSELHRIHSGPGPGEASVALLGDQIGVVARENAEALLARVPIVCEGATEVALLQACLVGGASSDSPGEALSLGGFSLIDGKGHEKAISLANRLLEAGYRIGTFLDNEKRLSGKREALKGNQGVAFGCFGAYENTEVAFSAEIPIERLDEWLGVGTFDERDKEKRCQQFGEILGTPGTCLPSGRIESCGEEAVRRALGSAAHKSSWFKSEMCRDAFARWAQDGGIPPTLQAYLDAFWQALDGIPRGEA